MKILEISKGIPHIEDLPVDEFISVLENLHNYEITEKVDGAEIIFGIDETGFYTSRELKGGQRIYSVDDYEMSFPSTYMRSAHSLLETALPRLRAAGLKRGDQVEAEVLYGELPNVVPYSEDRSYLIFLRTTQGTANIDRLEQKLDGQLLSVTLDTPYTDDGRNIQIRESVNDWQFSRVPVRKCPNISGQLGVYLKELKSFLSVKDKKVGQTYKTIVETPLNRIPDWASNPDWTELKKYLKERRDYINDMMFHGHVKYIKNMLLDTMVRGKQSEFGPSIEEGGWIEGIVLKETRTGRMVKIVDKDIFGNIRELAWGQRNLLTEHARSVDSSAGFIGRVVLDMATALGHPELGTIQAKRYLHKAGVITEDTLHILSEDTNFNSVKSYWSALLEIKTQELEQELDKYCNNGNDLLKEDRKLSKAVHRRTLETFASTFDKIEQFRQLTEEADNISDLFLILVGRHLGI